MTPASPLLGRVIFSLGARRSGTYLLQRVICAHPSVAEVPSETHLFSHGVAPLMERFQHDDPAAPTVGKVFADREAVIGQLRSLCDEVLGGFMEAGHDRVAERTPLHAEHAGLVAEIYPDARIVQIIRDGRDVARSLLAHDWGPDTIRDAAAEWRRAVEGPRRAGLDDDRYLELRYEQLVASPTEQIERLYRWLGLELGGSLDAAVAELARTPNADPSVPPGRPRVGRWQGGLTPEQVDEFERDAGDLLTQLGYSPAASMGGRRPLTGRLRRGTR